MKLLVRFGGIVSPFKDGGGDSSELGLWLLGLREA